ncbi:MAG TPA: GTP cyclohydrolase II RibA, partial [Actinomycetaceae bacterium]|nr:GTP cyclohydrolase II RibA [Actinomycetaceae bacterium]
DFTLHGYARAPGAEVEHVALVSGDLCSEEPPLVRVHSECFTGDSLGSARCDCGDQLAAALQTIAASPGGVLIYALGHEGRGIGLLGKLRAYGLQDEGADTVDANLALGLPIDSRDYSLSAAILQDLGLDAIRLLSSNPAKQEALESCGVRVAARVGMHVPPRPQNAAYLATKRARMRHDPPPDEAWELLRRGILATAPDPAGAELVTRYGPFASGPVVLAQLGQSLDGFIAPRSGVSTQLTGPEDHEHLHRMRALVDCVVIGAATAIADDPRLTTRLVPGDNPVRVVLDPAARVQPTSRLMSDGEAPTLWCVGTDAPTIAPPADHVTILRLATDNRGRFSPGQVRAALRKRGYHRQLIEGGGRLVSAFLAAGELDRLYLTTAPILIGDGVAGISFHGDAHLAGALRAPTRRFQLGADVCTELTFTPLAASSAEVSDDVVRSGVPAP